jgi:hypothetical protein
MGTALYLPLLFSALFGVAAPVLSQRLPPAAATWLLSGGGFLAAAASTASLTLLGFTLVAQLPQLASSGQWSDDALRRLDPVSLPVATLALAALGLIGVRVALAARRRGLALRDSYRLAAALPTHGGELAVVEASDVAAYAVPGRPGRIVVTTALLRRLDGGQRRALLAHERSHLRRRHHLHQAAAQVAIAANPLLTWLGPALAAACERWADEDAAVTCQRSTVADALVSAGIGNRRIAVPAVILAGVVDVASRVGALRAPAPRISAWRLALLGCLLSGAALTVLIAAHDTERLFELARFAYRQGHR